MRSIKFYISVFMVIGLISLNSFSFAGERYNIDVKSVKKAAQKNTVGGKAEIRWNAKVKNKTNEAQTYEIKMNFLNTENECVHETTKIATFRPNELKVVTQITSLKPSIFQDIDSGYVTISKINEQTLIAKLAKYMDMNINRNPDESVALTYAVKLKNNTDKSMTRNITVAFLDAENNYVKSETRKASFNAGESKSIKDMLELTAADADRIAKGHVTINY